MAEVEQAVRLLRDVVRRPVPGRSVGRCGPRVRHPVQRGRAVGGLGGGPLRARVVESGEYTKGGHGSAADWLGALSGSSAGAAKGRLAAAARAAQDPLLTEALHQGELSVPQLGLVTKASSETPEATADLLDLMNRGASHQELSDAAAQKRAASRSKENERLRRARVHTNRHFRWGQDEHGGIRGGFFCDEVEFARVAPRLEAEAKRRWKAAGNGNGNGAGGGDSLEAHRLDAFIDLLGGGSGDLCRGGFGPGGFGPGDDDDDDSRCRR